MGSNPIFPKSLMQKCPYSYVSSHYNLLVLKKRRVKKIIYSKSIINIVKLLYRSGAISYFSILNSTTSKQMYIKFTVFFYKNISFFQKLIQVSTSSKSFYITNKSLKLTQKIFKSTIIFVSTSKGYLTHKEALSLGLGGKIIYLLI